MLVLPRLCSDGTPDVRRPKLSLLILRMLAGMADLVPKASAALSHICTRKSGVRNGEKSCRLRDFLPHEEVECSHLRDSLGHRLWGGIGDERDTVTR
jgi:hypothetical protein